MKFNTDKCWLLNVNQQGQHRKFYLQDLELTSVEEEKDIGVSVDTNLTFRSHADEKTMKANRITGIIRLIFKHLYNSTIYY